jgi:NTE family protein
MITLPPHHAPLKIGLALGSGGARGWAHIGVLRRLRELGVNPQCIAGTSAGAIAAALYASDSLEAMEDLAAHLDWKQVAQLFLEVNFPRSGILTGKNVMRLLKRVIAVRAISSLHIPYAAVATDLEAEKEVILQSGNLFDAIRASIGIPGIFTPTRLNGKLLVDGGLVNPLPVSVCRAMGADLVIAVDVNLRAAPKNRKPVIKPLSSAPPQRIAALLTSLSLLMPQRPVPAASASRRWTAPAKNEVDPLSIFDVLTRSFRLVENQITRRELALNPPDILIQPEVGDIMTLEFHRGPEAIAAGIRAVDEVLSRLQPLLANQTRLANRNA